MKKRFKLARYVDSLSIRGEGREQKYTGTCLNGALWYNMHRKTTFLGVEKILSTATRPCYLYRKFHENVREISKKLKIRYFCPILLGFYAQYQFLQLLGAIVTAFQRILATLEFFAIFEGGKNHEKC